MLVKPCAACHIHVREGFDLLPEADDLEEDYLTRHGALIRIHG